MKHFKCITATPALATSANDKLLFLPLRKLVKDAVDAIGDVDEGKQEV